MGRKFTSSLAVGLLCAGLSGCVSSSPLENALSADILGYAHIVSLVDTHMTHRFELQKGVYEIGENEVFELVNEYNFSLLAAKREFETAQAEFERKQYGHWRPTLYANNSINGQKRDFRESVVNSRVGAGINLPDGSTVELFADNRFLENSIHRKDRTHTLGGRLTVPIPGIHPAYDSNKLRDFSEYLRVAKAENEYFSRMREVLFGGLNSYVSALKYKSLVDFQKKYLQKLNTVKTIISKEDEAQLEVLLVDGEKNLGRLNGKYEDKISGLKNQLGIPLEQKVGVKGKLNFEPMNFDKSALPKVLANDYNLRNLVLYLKHASLVKSVGKADKWGLRPTAFLGYTRELRGDDDLTAGFNLEFTLGPSKEREGNLSMQKFEYLISERKNALELQTITTLRNVELETQQIPAVIANAKKFEGVLKHAEKNFKEKGIKFSDLQIVLVDWQTKNEDLISDVSNGMELNYYLKSLFGELEK